MINKGSGEERKSRIEVKGKTVEKALKKALKELGASIEEVEIEIIEPGQKGVFNIFGSREAKIRVTKKKSSKGIEDIVDDVIHLIMECLNVNYRIFTEEWKETTYINVETAGVDGLLIGRKGDTLNSLQHLVGRIVSRKMRGYQRLTLDIGGYLKNRQEILKQKALKAADRARRTNSEVALEPMNSAERRIVHITLANLEGIITYTVGDGENRKVCVSPERDPKRKDSYGNKRNHNR